MPNSDDTLVKQTLALLATGADYHAYRSEQHLRMDDLTVRRRAAELVAEARAKLEGRLRAWRESSLAPSTREAPYPDDAAFRVLRRVRRVIDELATLETSIIAAPSAEALRWTDAEERIELLKTLVGADAELLVACADLGAASAELPIGDACGTEDDAASRPFLAIRAAIAAQLAARATRLG